MKSFRNDGDFKVMDAGTVAPTGTAPASTRRFQYGREFWEWVQADPTLQQELDQVINEKINTRFEVLRRDFDKRTEEEARQSHQKAEELGKHDGFEAGKRQGFEQAFSDRKVELEAVIVTLKELTQSIQNSQTTVIHSQQTAWLELFEHLLVQCLVPRADEIVRKIREWLVTELSEFNQNKKVRVTVSIGQFPQYQKALEGSSIENLALVADERLSSGDVRVDCDNGGMLFSDRLSLEKVRSVIQSVVPLS